MKTKLILLFSAIVLMVSCTKNDPAPVDLNSPSPELTAAQDYFDTNLKGIIQTSCASCHSTYATFQTAANKSGSMYTEVKRGSMPKGSNLTSSQKDSFKQFYDLVLAIP